MSKLLGYLGLGIGVVLLLGVAVVLVLQFGAGGATESAGPNQDLPAAQPQAQLHPQLQADLEQLGFRVFSRAPEAEDFLLPGLDNQELRLSSLRGKLVLINFWATWCPPCIEEMPSMQRLYDKLPRDNFEILAINLQEDRATVDAFVSQHGFSYPILLDFGGSVARRYAVRGLPTSYVVAPDGSMPAALLGFAHWDDPQIQESFRIMSGAEKQ